MNFKKLDDFLDKLTSWKIPGNDCIVIKDGETVYRHLSGYADIEAGRKMKGDETYNVWSCSKPVTCAAALTLYEKGVIELTDPLSDYLPEFANVKVEHKNSDGSVDLVPAKNKIKVKDLFSMSSGLSYNVDFPELNEVRQKSNGRCPTRDVVRAIASSPLEFEPGTHWLYGLSHDVLAGLVEEVSGVSFNEYVTENIFKPLGMKESTFGSPSEELVSRMARQYEYNDELGRAVPTDNSVSFKFGPDYHSGGAGLITTVEDYSKFSYAMANGGLGLNGERILSTRTVALMGQNAMNETQMKDINWSNLGGYGYGLGVRTMVTPADGGSNGPVGEFGWGGAAGAWVIIDPVNRLTLFYAEHLLNSQEPYISPRLRNVLYSCLD